MARRRTGRGKPRGLSAADTTILVSRTKRRGSIQSLLSLAFPVRLCFLALLFRTSLFFRARRFDDAVNLARRKGRGALAPGFLADGAQNLGLGSGKPDIVPDAQQDRPRSAPLLDHQRAAFLIDAVQQLAKGRPGSQGGNHDTVLCSGPSARHKLSSSPL